MKKIIAFIDGRGAIDYLRVRQPLEYLKVAGLAEVRMVTKGEELEWFDIQGGAQLFQQQMEWADAIFFPRVSDARLLDMLSEMKKAGKKFLTDWDDNFFEISPLSPAYKHFGLKNYSHTIDGETLPVWEDGNNINLELNRTRMDTRLKALALADVLFVTTPVLKDVYRHYCSNIKVAPNSIDTRIWRKLPFVPHDGVRVGWFGGDSHYEDWCLLAPCLKDFMEENPEVTLVIGGSLFKGTLKGIPPERIEHHPWGHYMAHPYRMATMDLDFGIIPLVDNAFNNGKSPIKWLEMGALQIPTVTSYVQPYSPLMDMVKDNGVFIDENDPAAWKMAMTMMVKDPKGRKEIGRNAAETVHNFFDYEVTHKLWSEAIEELWRPQPSPLQVV